MPDKGITNIAYNHLNLPKQISQQNITNYLYRADGVKLKKSYTINNVAGSHIVNTEYLDGFQYVTQSAMAREALMETDDNTLSAKTAGEEESFVAPEAIIDVPNPTNATMALSFFPTAEGFYDYTKNQYIYQYKDHLGNVRLSYTKNTATNELEILDRNDYYPFGMNFVGYHSVFDAMGSAYNYKFQEQELQETGFYAFKWRQYMTDVGRFFNVDPLAEKYTYNSPYAFSENRVIDGRELEGLEWVKSTTLNQDGTKTYTFNGAVKLVNNSKTYTAQDIKTFQTDLTQQLKDSFNGTLSNGDKIEIGQVSYSIVDKVQDGDYSLSINDVVIGNDGKPMEGNVKGKNQSPDHISNSQENNMQVVPSGKDTADYATHEIGHSLGLRHQRDDKNNKEIKDKMTPTNLMYSPQFPGSGAKVIPEQRNVIINNVPHEKKE